MRRGAMTSLRAAAKPDPEAAQHQPLAPSTRTIRGISALAGGRKEAVSKRRVAGASRAVYPAHSYAKCGRCGRGLTGLTRINPPLRRFRFISTASPSKAQNVRSSSWITRSSLTLLV